ncbi:MAG: 3-phosphoshikimate 1-carboxyvinyltransferase [Desulfatirhabdiaceae bacterium]
MIEIYPASIPDQTVRVPGSKSYTHRALIASALSTGPCRITNALDSDDTRLTRKALRQLGIQLDIQQTHWTITGASGKFRPCKAPIHLGNSGTSMRLLTALCALGQGTYCLTGSPRMQERPIGELLDGLDQLGVPARSVAGNGCPPVEVDGGAVSGGRVLLDCSISSQFLSALLLIAPCTTNGIEIVVTRGPVSKPYIDMTVDVMTGFGIQVSRKKYDRFNVSGGQTYRRRDFGIEPDASQAGYFWAAAALTGAAIKVAGITKDSTQGDVRFVSVLERMGCRIDAADDGITVTGGNLSGIDVDMGHMPDLVPTLAVVAAFAAGTTRIHHVAHLRAKESDRLAATAAELTKMGVSVTCLDDGLEIIGGSPHGAVIDTHDDHRMAMSFAVAGLVIPGIRILNETCVEKSFPDFWKVLKAVQSGNIL